jgi:hypothetical protein
VNDAEMMKHFGVFPLGDIEQEPWIRLSMSTVRDMVTQAWTEGWDAHLQYMQAPYVWPIAKTHENPYEWSKK